MFQDFKDEVLDPSLQPDTNPRYTIKDNNGKVISDDVQIEMKTPVVQNPTPLNRANIRNLQADLYTQDRYSTPSYSGTAMTLDLPLTSYETGKIVKITAPATLTNPTLNINGLGAKTIKSIINKGENYTLIYNGMNWDLINATDPYITGSFTQSGVESTHEIITGFKPSLVICYASENNSKQIASYTRISSSPEYDAVPRIYSKAYSDGEGGCITDNGFVFIGTQYDNSYSTVVYYIAYR